MGVLKTWKDVISRLVITNKEEVRGDIMYMSGLSLVNNLLLNLVSKGQSSPTDNIVMNFITSLKTVISLIVT